MRVMRKVQGPVPSNPLHQVHQNTDRCAVDVYDMAQVDQVYCHVGADRGSSLVQNVWCHRLVEARSRDGEHGGACVFLDQNVHPTLAPEQLGKIFTDNSLPAGFQLLAR